MGSSLTDQADQIAAAFVAARHARRALDAYPGERPGDLAGAYAIQDRALALDGRPVAGWKVGRINPPYEAALGANRLAGPIFADLVVDAGPGAEPAMPVIAEGFAAAEAEFMLHVAAGWDGTVPTDDAATRAIVDAVRLGIEIASSPYPGINADGPCVTASDFGNNLGAVLGAPLVEWQAIDLCAVPVRTVINGEVIGAATAAAMLDGPYGAVRFLLAHLAGRGIDASRGLWVSTGAVTGVHPVRPGDHVVAEFGDLGQVACRITTR
ncbi:2-keto-4-pentenoate hydratase [Novosphingobium piscinae]|uniref:Fumarylacetoacetate hydrolase family protein n=1 Tax=Novosphingobium piscinae TaxID=1507448 RepID=A0A7X1KNN7_9SPHN|nr:fumarylacetoacetate hydrolase family protein [Novosphingobium piscinae]MBC2667545.1 fumarylacetoacetate hydrolase family protein [Novosphingobium piscinae]